MVNVEPDGTWRSTDNKFGTAAPKLSRAGSEESTPIDKGKVKAENQDSLTIDSDDDIPLIKKRTFPNFDSQASSRAGTAEGVTRKAEVIDLTLSDSEEEAEVPQRKGPTDQYAAYGDVRARYDQEALQQAEARRRINMQEEQYKRQRMD